ncbi:hypothetical protein [Streptomyces agglomeratus]|uniref:hypothetical protein n=1 Tax=Streptomyces agglomeratus TaxID=285458 RepID=UPI000854DD73|nr:hypothetical protein [Streptomyces agglomeratus]OEJ36538.1 hypothetical protein BGK72_38230 [Streptomyces agglomeratus]
MTTNRLEEFEFDCVSAVDPSFEVPARAFLRRIGRSRLFDELIRPALDEGSALVAVAQRTRPWPPWGIGARTISAMEIAVPRAEGAAGLTSVLAVPEESTEIGLLSAVHATLLDGLADRGVERVHLTVREGAAFGEWLASGAGFARSDSLVLTEHSRYWLHDATISEHRRAIGLEEANVDDLLTGGALKGDAYTRAVVYLLGVAQALAPSWDEQLTAGEVIANTGPGMVARCLPPGGPPALEQ